jgi:hypothetical protein
MFVAGLEKVVFTVRFNIFVVDGLLTMLGLDNTMASIKGILILIHN